MVAVIVLAVLGLVAAGLALSRIASNRAERRSVEGYEHVLDVLGDVSKRSDASAQVHLPSRAELARPHVASSEKDARRFRPAAGPGPGVPAAMVRLTPPALPNPPQASADTAPELVAAASDVEGAAPLADADVEGADLETGSLGTGVLADRDVHAGSRPRRVRRHEIARRPGALTAAAIVIVAAAAVGAWRLSSMHSTPTPRVQQPAATHHSHDKSPRKARSAPPSTVLSPTTSSDTVVTFEVPSSTFTITFSASGTCWLGVPKQGSTSSWLWMKTLLAGQSASYAASGPTTVRLGAPRSVVLSIDGKTVDLPAGNVRPYDVVFAPVATSA